MFFSDKKWLTKMTKVLSWAFAMQWGKMAENGPSRCTSPVGTSKGAGAILPSVWNWRTMDVLQKWKLTLSSLLGGIFITNVQSRAESLNRERKSHKTVQSTCLDNNNNRKFAHYYFPWRLIKTKHELKSSANLFWCTCKRKDTLRTLFKKKKSFAKCVLGFWPAVIQC